MYVFETFGAAKTFQKLTPGNTISSLLAECFKYTERDLAFTSGGTTEIVPGDWIVGATSAARAEVVLVTLTSGTWAGGDAAGTFRIRSQNGTFQSENVKVAAGTNDATIAANSKLATDNYPFKDVLARAAIVSVLTNTALFSLTGGKPDQALLMGHSLEAGSSMLLKDVDSIRNFRCVDAVAGNASVLKITYFF